MIDYSPSERAQLVADLTAARDELVRRGRCTGKLVSADGRVCAYGAVAVSVVGEDFVDMFVSQRKVPQRFTGIALLEYPMHLLLGESGDRIKRAMDFLGDHVPLTPRIGLHPVEEFNDASTTSDSDVLTVLDKALAELGGLA